MIQIARIKFFLFFNLFILVSFLSFSQQKKNEIRENYHFTYFGINYSPIIPSNIIQKNDVTIVRDSITMSINQKPGFVFGMEVKHDFTRFFALQTGLNFIRRTYNVYVKDKDTSHTASLKFIGYEIPLLGLGFVRVAEHFYANVSAGFCFNFFPSDIAVSKFYGQRYRWTQIAIMANVGIEYRNENYGNFYVGVMYQHQERSMMTVFYFREYVYGKSNAYIGLSGNYLSLNLKYYFPQNPQKEKKKKRYGDN